MGLTAKLPAANFTITLDRYFVRINDRVVFTGQFQGLGTDTELDNLLAQADATAAFFFANAIDTESKGLDIVMTHKIRFGNQWSLKSDLAGTFTKIRQVGNTNASQVLKVVGWRHLFS